ncbi:MAG TPA: hypothetical protein DHW34_02335 [Actinobacteria bacterium]|nr:hypothetical protein [Actinomycetota bacterium]
MTTVHAVTDDTQGTGDADSLVPEDERARAIILRQLASSARTREHLRQKLAGKGISAAVAREVLDRFTEVGLIDDVTFARDYITSRRTARGISQRGLRQELTRKGVPEDIITEALSATTIDEERELALATVTKRWRSVATLEPPARRRRLASALARRGFPPELTYEVIREVEARMGAVGNDDEVTDLIEPD